VIYVYNSNIVIFKEQYMIEDEKTMILFLKDTRIGFMSKEKFRKVFNFRSNSKFWRRIPHNLEIKENKNVYNIYSFTKKEVKKCRKKHANVDIWGWDSETIVYNFDEKKKINEDALSQGADTFNQLSELLGKQTAAGKAAAIAEATINTYKAATSAYSSLSGIPIVGPALGAVAAGVAVAAGIANVKKILAVKTPGGGGSAGAGAGVSGGGATVAPGTAPNVSFVSSSENQIANTINRNQASQAPIKAYVVSSDMTTQQQLDRNLVNKTSIG